LAVFLKGEGYKVKEVNTVLTDRQRAKAPHPDRSDTIDAKVIARVLIDQYDELPEAGSEEVAKALKELIQHRTVLVRNRTALRNRMHSLLYQQYPTYEAFFDAPFRKTALAFWERFPSPGHLKGFGAKRLARYLRKHGNPHTGEAKAEQLLKAADKTREVSYVQQQRDFLVRDLVAQLRSLDERIDMVVERMDALLSQTGQTLTTMDGVDTVSAAMVVANADVQRITSAAKLARHAGVAPLDNSSGKVSN
jgi:transposase